MATILDEIVAHKRREVAQARRDRPLERVRAEAADTGRPRNFYRALTRPPAGQIHVIAEVKRASPSAGVIREDFDPAAIAAAYQAAGASAVSVLTDRKYFQGGLEHLRAVRGAVDLPILRKDFIIDAYQVYEARAAGADAVLLIAEVLTDGELSDLMILAAEVNLTVLLEVHGIDSLLRVRSMIGFPRPGYSVLGINNRDLKTFQVDLSHTLRLAPLAAADTVLVSESGIRSGADAARLAAAGVRAVLVGEALMRSDDVAAAMGELLRRP